MPKRKPYGFCEKHDIPWDEAYCCPTCYEEDIRAEERDRIKKIHQHHRGMDWGVNEERMWKEVEGA